jgi:pilus assembly protein FimV
VRKAVTSSSNEPPLPEANRPIPVLKPGAFKPQPTENAVAPKPEPTENAAAPKPEPTENAAAPKPEPKPEPVFKPVPAENTRVFKPVPAESAPGGGYQVVVKAGDNASKIAAKTKPAEVSLDQMLVALLRGNPAAFISGNINTIKSGAVLDIPSTETVNAIPDTEARQVIVAQSKDFNAFRRKLAERVSAAPVAGADRQIGGNLQANVQDRAVASPAPDILTITKGAVQGKPASTTEDKIAKGLEAKDTSTRVAELTQNISDLNKLGVGPAAAAPAGKPAAVPAVTVLTPSSLPVQAATQAASSPAATASTPLSAPLTAASGAGLDTAAGAAAPASDASSAAAPLAAASEPALTASATVAPRPVALKKPVVTPPPPEPSLVDQVLDNAVPLLGGVGLLALLGGGFAFLRNRQQKKKKAAPIDSSFLESRLQPDSFFGASGGSRVNTSSENDGSSMAYTPSQMDASGDVDPVAEADVYLAYGRDEQAEDILKEALHTYPARVAIHAKLLEIYAKRRDIKTFERLAGEAFKLTQGQGSEWATIAELGAELDPANPLYHASGAAPAKNQHAELPAAASAVTAPNVALAPAASVAPAGVDMDFALDEAPSPVVAAIPVAITAPSPSMAPPVASPATAIPPASTLDDLDLGLSFDLDPAPAAAIPPAPPLEIDTLSNALDFTPTPTPVAATPKPSAAPKPAPAPAPAASPADDGMMEFDLDALSFDLGSSPAKPASASAPAESPAEDPLEIKFLLAEEFRSLGDTDGARSLADEVLAKAKGPLKTKVQSFLNALS